MLQDLRGPKEGPAGPARFQHGIAEAMALEDFPGVQDFRRLAGMGRIAGDGPEQGMQVGRLRIALLVGAAEIGVAPGAAIHLGPGLGDIPQGGHGQGPHPIEGTLPGLFSRRQLGLHMIELKRLLRMPGWTKAPPWARKASEGDKATKRQGRARMQVQDFIGLPSFRIRPSCFPMPTPGREDRSRRGVFRGYGIGGYCVYHPRFLPAPA